MIGKEDWRILYEIICCAEWKEVGTTAVTLGTGKRNLTPCKTQLGPDWIYAISPDLHFLAVLQDSTLEIRNVKDNFASVLAKNSQAPGIVKDAYPWLRLLAWSPDSSLLAVSFTNGLLTFFDVTAAHLFSIKINGDDVGGPPSFSPSSALCSMFFMTDRIVVAPSLNCVRELVTVSGRGILKCYRQPSGEGAALSFHHEMSFRRYYPRGILQVQHVPTHSIFIIAGYLHLESNSAEQEIEKSHSFGITCWRILHDHPYYNIAHRILDSQQTIRPGLGLGLWTIALSWTKQYSGRGCNSPEDCVCKLRLSPDGLRVAGIHESGAISIWHVPSLKLQCVWPLDSQLHRDTENPQFNQRWRVAFNANANHHLDPIRFHPYDINWWKNDCVIVSRVNGCVTLLSVGIGENIPDRNLLGDSPELFESPLLVSPKGEGRGFFALECEIRQGKDEDAEALNGVHGKWRLTSLVTDSLFWLMDIERFRPAPKKRHGALGTESTAVRTYRFYGLQSITPVELFHRRIEAEEYGDALDLAKLYDLDPDLVYQKQWTRTIVSLHSIRDYLAKIKKRNWVLQECLERVPESVEAARELLEFGLKGTDLTPAVMISQGRDKGRFIMWSRDDLDISESEYISLIDPENEEVRRLLRYRQQFLHFLDMLQTYELMLGGPLQAEENFDPIVFGRLRSRSPWDSSIHMAKDCDIPGLQILLTHHWSGMASHYLQIISSFPETISPHDYRDFLPSLEEDGQVILWSDIAHKELDWSHEYLTKEDEESMESITSTTIETWYDQRIRQIESRTGLVNFSLDLGRLGLERNVQSLRKLVENLETVEVLIYQLGLDDVTLGSLEALNNFERLKLLMSTSTEETFLTHMRHLVLPFLAKCEERIPESRITLLNQYLSSLALTDLNIVLKFFTASKQDESQPLLSSQELMVLAYNSIYACENPKESDNILGILGCIPSRGYRIEADSKLEALHDSIDELEIHYSIGQMLRKYDIWMSLTEIEALTHKSEASIQEFILDISHAAIRMVPPLKLNDWKTLLYDIIELKKKLLLKFPTEKCFELYVGALLRSGVESVINLARDFVGESGTSPSSERYSSAFSIYLCNIPSGRITEMILDASQIYFDSSSSYSDIDMSHAKTALSLLPQVGIEAQKNSRTQILLDLIDALKLLNKDFNLNILPQTVRRTRKRLALIETAMKNVKRGYKKIQQLLKLSIFLHVGEKSTEDGDDDTQEIMGAERAESLIMEMCGEAGMEEGDLTWVVQLCHSLMGKGYGVGWCLFYRLAKLDHDANFEEEPSIIDNETRLAFINHALTLCPQDQILTLLRSKYLIEIRSLQSRLNELSPSDSTSDVGIETDIPAQSANDGTLVDDVLHKNRIQGFLKTTTSWINPLKDLAKGSLIRTIQWPNSQGRDNSSSLSYAAFQQERPDLGNEDLEKEGYPAFQLGSCTNPDTFHTSQLCYNYDSFSSSSSSLLPKGTSPALELCLILYRIWHLERLILGWNQVEPQDSDVVSCLVCDILPEDLGWGLALLISIDETTEALRILSTLPPTQLLSLTRLYYLALAIKKRTDGLNSIQGNNLCYQNPNQLIAEVKRICAERKFEKKGGPNKKDNDLHFLMNQFQDFVVQI